ncbi:uncharacterized protein BDR25DRAFT_325186 [Lindgomyces ingoldianus]|uniref:Uncharacterized protein n=1 Tax=Lindgomyces ingoldianus TaxID=673940 RepID=A0ACB6QWS3_9PLEO|nr:uncharacterized protein BDR25DRAFT_325186 [Lindgomyces ingoldianus]KAF2471463.1 hypothetical protein BDR25DRAFT_325186 [Lindgomyces ingoldianus]
MSPISQPLKAFSTNVLTKRVVDRPTNPDGLVLEAWAQGYMVGSLIIMACITLANMRQGVILHKLILLELILGIWHGFWIFFHNPIYAWWLSVSAIFLNISWSLHNVIAWMKIKPFLSTPVSWIFIGTVVLVQPYWVLEIYANFAYFHNINTIFLKTRPWEALCRDPWWIFTTVALFWNIKVRYEMTFKEIIRISPRFGIMLGAMLLSIIFIILDICSVTDAFKSTLPVGINPFWKLSFVFKCLTDSVVLDDFKTALDRLRAFKISRLGSFSQDTTDRRARNDGALVHTWEEMATEANARPAMPSPDGDYVQHNHFPGFKLCRKHREHREHREHKDSVVVPEQQHRDSSSKSLRPEDIVPSALEDLPIRSVEHACVAEKRPPDFWVSLRDEGHLAEESDYAQALREVEGQSPPASPSRKSFPRRSRSP